MRNTIFLSCFGYFVIFKTILAGLNSINVEYAVSMASKCQRNATKLTLITAISKQSCVLECVARKRCVGISYSRRVSLCELLLSINSTTFVDGDCDIVRKSDVIFDTVSTIKLKSTVNLFLNNILCELVSFTKKRTHIIAATMLHYMFVCEYEC